MPVLVNIFNDCIPYMLYTFTLSKLPCYSTPYQAQIQPLPIILDLGLGKKCTTEPVLNINNIFNHILNSRFADYLVIYTDASKNQITGATGYGIYIPQANIRISRKVSSYNQIMAAELLAIMHALTLSSSLSSSRILILSDSLSGLNHLKRPGINNLDRTSLSIKSLLQSLKCANINTVIAWIPGHVGIVGNTIADDLAKLGTQRATQSNHLRVHYNNIVPHIKNQLMVKWQEEWNSSSEIRGRSFQQVQNSVRKKPWFANLSLEKKIISNICRLRLGHCQTPFHLNRINILDSNLCTCGQIGDAPHILFNCTNHYAASNKLYWELSKIFSPPISLNIVLSNPTAEVCSAISIFLRTINLNL